MPGWIVRKNRRDYDEQAGGISSVQVSSLNHRDPDFDPVDQESEIEIFDSLHYMNTSVASVKQIIDDCLPDHDIPDMHSRFLRYVEFLYLIHPVNNVRFQALWKVLDCFHWTNIIPSCNIWNLPLMAWDSYVLPHLSNECYINALQKACMILWMACLGSSEIRSSEWFSVVFGSVLFMTCKVSGDHS